MSSNRWRLACRARELAGSARRRCWEHRGHRLLLLGAGLLGINLLQGLPASSLPAPTQEASVEVAATPELLLPQLAADDTAAASSATHVSPLQGSGRQPEIILVEPEEEWTQDAAGGGIDSLP